MNRAIRMKVSTVEHGALAATLEAIRAGSAPIVDLSCQGLSGVSLKVLCKALANDKVVRILKLKGNAIGDAGAQVIASLLKRNRHIVRLDLSRTNIGPKGVQVLAAALSTNHTLNKLDLSFNAIGDAGAVFIASQTRSTVCNLTWLNLFHNAISDDGITALATALRSNQSLVFLNVGHNRMGQVGCVAIANALSRNRTLQMLDVSCNQIGESGAASLASLLRLSSLISLIAHTNAIGDEGALKIASVLSSCSQLECLDIRFNGIAEKGINNFSRELNSDERYPILPLLKITVNRQDPLLGISVEEPVELTEAWSTRLHRSLAHRSLTKPVSAKKQPPSRFMSESSFVSTAPAQSVRGVSSSFEHDEFDLVDPESNYVARTSVLQSNWRTGPMFQTLYN